MEDGETAHVTDLDRNEDALIYLYDGGNEVPTVELINGLNDDAQLMIDTECAFSKTLKPHRNAF